MPGLSTQATYRVSSALDLGGTYTLSRTWGNFDGESLSRRAGGERQPVLSRVRQEAWNYPEGDLATDQRHRARLWANYGLPWVPGLTLSALQTLETGVPYGAVTASGVDPQPFVVNPGYLTPPTGSTTVYYFTARDAFRTEGQRRTDIAVNYSYRHQWTGQDSVLRPASGHQHLQPVPALRVRRARGPERGSHPHRTDRPGGADSSDDSGGAIRRSIRSPRRRSKA